VLQVQTTSQFKIYGDNPFVPTSVAAALTSPTAFLNVTRYSRDMGYNEVIGNDYVTRFAGGFKGSISDTWSYDVDFAHQSTHQELDIRTAISRNLYAAADAVRNPNTGQIVCRSQYYNGNTFVPGGTGMDPGCVPLNIFGDGAASAQATNYVMGWNTADIELRQDTIDLNLRGDLGQRLSLGAGPISFATGANYRRMTADRTVDPLSNIVKDGTGIRAFPTALQGSIGGYSYYNPSPLSGRISVTEAYGEIGIPLLKDRTAFKDLSTTLAGRVTDYSQSGVQTTWKIGVNWSVNDSVRLRGTVSSDIRAPTVLELFNTATVARGTYTLPYSTAPKTFTGSGQNVSVGNPNLAPENARTYVAGAVFSPTFLPRFRASIDWYRINMLGQISAPGNQQILDNCAAGDQFYCSLVKVNGQPVKGTSAITAADFVEVTAPLLNQPANLNVSGIDFEVAYSTPLVGHNLTLRLTGNNLLQYSDPSQACAASSTGAAPKTDFVGAIGACGNHPALRFRLSGQYNVGPVGIYVQERYIDHAKRNPNYVTGIDISDNDIPAVWYTDFNLTWNLGMWSKQTELYFNVTNLFDQDPPPTNSTVGRSWVDPTQQSVYDMLGRRFIAGVRFRW
jgi:outer membrane receptor protein involved in Fe transport